MKWFFLFLSLLFAVVLESTITNLPLVLLVLFLAMILIRSGSLFVWGFFAGLILDSLRLQLLGESSIFFLVFLVLVLLYERKFETRSIPFVFIFSFLGSFVYVWILGERNILLQAIIGACISGIFFLCIQFFLKQVLKIKL